MMSRALARQSKQIWSNGDSFHDSDQRTEAQIDC